MVLFDRIDNSLEIITQVKNSFDIQELVIGSLSFGSNIPVILVQFKSLDHLERQWKELNSLVTGEYLIKLDNEFSKWNSYIFFVTEEVSKSLKYEIENNKFSTRKIVIEMETPVINGDIINNIVSEHIVNDDIEFDIQITDVGEFPRNELLGKVIDDFIKDNSKKADDTTLTELLTKIEKGLNNEN
ncbi:ABC-three component system middle component 1 [Elizabethkingia sp. M8]|uniref:ABC-three component system middle component 1 n=1 Tax=Elizabethkingia sp. M8 TaxID=2796140 RepID=UPI00190571BF|nr:ABC-three component system middle component 1 [Elizabethkingia sp. M8]QQM28189.1 hypothetical protein JCR23_07155 [Elizabethkingia sp. M8]